MVFMVVLELMVNQIERELLDLSVLVQHQVVFGRVRKMPGHYGVDSRTVYGLTVLYIDPKNQEVWISGPVPGFNSSSVRIEKVGKKAQLV